MNKRTITERDLRFLHTFCAAAEAGGFAAAEGRLHMTKATISRQIKEVEENLGVTLCSRGPQGFELTEAGKTALKYAKEALDALDRIVPQLDAMRGVISGKLRIGITDNLLGNPSAKISQALTRLKKEAPEVEFSLYTLTTHELVESLRTRRLDIIIKGIHPGQEIKSFNYTKLFGEKHFICYSPQDNCEVSEMSLVFREKHPFVEDAIANYGFKVGPVVSGMESVATLISTGLFAGILPEQYSAMLSSVFPLEQIPDTPEYNVNHFAVTNADYPLTPASEAFVKLLIEEHQGVE
ncbi:LysR family transcriptional regulator [Marinobacterium lutimaris]|uniref:Transcriptional regulator, LysR family n=1 Tax=Marinobacterium lutimaris TaxID=568106 RepID=A0A1H6CUV2_9GAMM|nr:LysR family transcriptional regulator [Marinobacterium lutimaris]SEG76186.1 transcriptional regulator, LysR family [Marinobacterium lutimaris]